MGVGLRHKYLLMLPGDSKVQASLGTTEYREDQESAMMAEQAKCGPLRFLLIKYHGPKATPVAAFLLQEQR